MSAALMAAITRPMKRWKSLSGRAAEGGVTLEREVGRIDLQLEAGADDGLVLDAQRRRDGIEIGVEAGIVLVLHDRGEDARRRGRDEGSGRALPEAAVGGLEGGALGVELGLADIGHGTDALGQEGDVADRFALASDRARSSLNFG